MKVRKPLASRKARLISAAGSTYLVEWREGKELRRAYIPGELWNEAGVPEPVLAEGVQYGADWESIIKIHVDSIGLAQELRESGIWTVEDFRSRITEVEGLFKSATRLDVFTVLSKMEV